MLQIINHSNQNIMKKYFALAAIAALTLASCAKVDTYKVVENEDAIIAFSNYSPKAITRADADNYATSTTLIANADFDVYGWSTANGTSFTGSNGTKFFAASAPAWYTVTYKTDGNSDGSKNAYPDGYRYWPSGDTPDYLSFYAYYPSNAGTISAPDGLGAFTFTAEAAAADQVDFMVADVVKDQVYDATNSGTNGTVALTFKHMLTKVQFKFKRAIDYDSDNDNVLDDCDPNTVIKLTEVKLENVKTTGTLTSSFNGTATSTVWSAQAKESTAKIFDVYVAGADVSSSNKVTLNKDVTTVNPEDIFLMVPQTMVANTDATNAQKVVITWETITNGVTTTNTRTIYLDDCVTTDGGSTAADIDWEKNHSVVYTITIGPKPILFTATVAVENWNTDQAGFYNIQ